MRNSLPNKYTVIDIETTGFSYKYCKIIELSAIKVVDDEIVDTYSELINPNEEISYFITRLTGITNEMLKDAKTIDEVLPSFISFVGDDLVLGHNVRFDISFINENTIKYYGYVFENEYLDTVSLSRRIWHGNVRHRLCDLIERCKLGGSQEHRGLSDCMYTYKAYLYMKDLL